jgi:predicted nucleotidyltransferase
MTNRVEDGLRRAASDLSDIGCRWALVGGLAVSARCEPRLTRDVDVAVAVQSDDEAEGAVHALQQRGYGVQAVVEQTARHRMATARLVVPGGSGVLVDMLFASSGIEPEIVARAESVSILPGLTVPLARTGHLLAMKVLAREDRARPQDADDLRALLAVASVEDLNEARGALDLITVRGFARGRDLQALWAALLSLLPGED